MEFENIISTTETHYSNKVQQYGTQYKGVDWGSDDGQRIRFEQLLKFIDLKQKPSLIDYGCGYGALLDLLRDRKFGGKYQGYDISEAMIQEAIKSYGTYIPDLVFTCKDSELKTADYTLVSGIFNVKLETPDEQWVPYIFKTLKKIAGLSRHGFVFNALSSYTPIDDREDDLYYADPKEIFDYCMTEFPGGVAISHDYVLSDFTVFVKFRP